MLWRTKNFSKKLEVLRVLRLKVLRLKTQHFHTKLPCQKPMLRQIKREIKKWPITKNGVSPATTLFFWKFCFSLRTFYKELIWCTNYLNVYIQTFYKRWSFIWGCFFHVGIFKTRTNSNFAVNLAEMPKKHHSFPSIWRITFFKDLYSLISETRMYRN